MDSRVTFQRPLVCRTYEFKVFAISKFGFSEVKNTVHIEGLQFYSAQMKVVNGLKISNATAL